MISVSKAPIFEEFHLHGEHRVDVDWRRTVSTLSPSQLQCITFTKNEVCKHP